MNEAQDPSAAVPAPLFASRTPALLALADGTVFRGPAIGAHDVAVGEVVFNTAMTGYQEILTDPSYAGQIVTLTYPHIGNVGRQRRGRRVDAHVRGRTRDPRSAARSRRAGGRSRTCPLTCARANIVGIADIDTRKLTRILREKGAQNGCIVAGPGVETRRGRRRGAGARRAVDGGARPREGRLVHEPYEWTTARGRSAPAIGRWAQPRFHVVAYDYGVKHNILRMLAARGCRLTVVPAQMPARDVLAMKPDGVFLSNGPGDPEPCDYAIAAIREIIAAGMPVFGICLGHQLLGLAAGGRTLKMKFGHHGANHPVLDRDTGQVLITSQNHGFAVDPASLPANVRVTHVSLFDGSLQGFAWTDKPVFCFQGHPEASPGPHDVGYLFDRFVKLMEKQV